MKMKRCLVQNGHGQHGPSAYYVLSYFGRRSIQGPYDSHPPRLGARLKRRSIICRTSIQCLDLGPPDPQAWVQIFRLNPLLRVVVSGTPFPPPSVKRFVVTSVPSPSDNSKRPWSRAGHSLAAWNTYLPYISFLIFHFLLFNHYYFIRISFIFSNYFIPPESMRRWRLRELQ